jgi:phosphatidylserine synthase
VLSWVSLDLRLALADGIAVVLPFIALATGYLMVSTVRYVHLPNRYLRGRRSVRKIAQLAFAAIAIGALIPEIALALSFLGFAVSGLVAGVMERVRGGMEQAAAAQRSGAAPAASTVAAGPAVPKPDLALRPDLAPVEVDRHPAP